jgi:hypothetical protein
MLICIPDILSKDDVADFRRIMDAEAWEDGRSTAGAQSAEVKKNEQLPPDGGTSRQLGERILRALAGNTLFVSAAVPLHIFPPLFNRYVSGQFFGEHVDNCIRGDRLTGLRIRTDLSITLFLSEPEEYDGGELWLPPGQAAGGPCRPVPVDQPAPGDSGHEGRAHQLLFLAAEHDQGPACAADDLRHGPCGPDTGPPLGPQRSRGPKTH